MWEDEITETHVCKDKVPDAAIEKLSDVWFLTLSDKEFCYGVPVTYCPFCGSVLNKSRLS